MLQQTHDVLQDFVSGNDRVVGHGRGWDAIAQLRRDSCQYSAHGLCNDSASRWHRWLPIPLQLERGRCPDRERPGCSGAEGLDDLQGRPRHARCNDAILSAHPAWDCLLVIKSDREAELDGSSAEMPCFVSCCGYFADSGCGLST